MQAYEQFPQADGSFLYWPYDGTAMNKEQANAAFALLNYDQRVAACYPNKPVLADGFSSWKVRETVVVTPPTSTLFGAPRTFLGTHNGYKVYAVTVSGSTYLLELYSESPDQFAPKGVNLTGIVLSPGATVPAGISTAYSGQAAPDGFTKPTGYRKRYFGGNADQAYYELSTLADETPTTPPTGGGGDTGGGATGGTSGDDPASTIDLSTENPDSIQYYNA